MADNQPQAPIPQPYEPKTPKEMTIKMLEEFKEVAGGNIVQLDKKISETKTQYETYMKQMTEAKAQFVKKLAEIETMIGYVKAASKRAGIK